MEEYMISITRVRILDCFRIAVVVLVLTAAAQAAPKAYKQENRYYVTEIVKGKPEIALEYSKDYLSQYPEDLEALYIQAAAYCQMNEVGKAVISTKKALELGLPFERFLAGPRNLFKPLYASKEFKKLAKQRKIRLIHGPVVGAVTATSARFWVRTASEAPVKIIVTDEKGLMDKPVSNTAAAGKENDYTCVVEVTGLRPGTRYVYQVEIDGAKIALDPKPSFRTFSDTARPAKFTIGFGGGAGYTPWLERMWLTILKHSPSAFLLLGDNVYIDTPEVPETQRYCYYRRQSRPEYRQFAAVTPIYAIWDDHDFGTNDCWSSQSLDDPPWKMDTAEESRLLVRFLHR
jgi:alkaline phosphatase D